MSFIKNTAKIALRAKIQKAIKAMTTETKNCQSESISKKILSMPIFVESKRVSIYLSTDNEVNTIVLLEEMFNQKKQVFVPTYNGDNMEMVKLKDLEDYESLPLTKWNIKQPNFGDGRENALDTGKLDLILMPGVAFTKLGGRCGHGRGYYDKFLLRHFMKYPLEAQTLNGATTKLIGLAFKEQIVDENDLPIEAHDYPLDFIVTSD